jgi:hypothetical protein
MLEFPLNKLQILSIDCFYFFWFELKMVIFLSQTESNPKIFFRKKALYVCICVCVCVSV